MEDIRVINIIFYKGKSFFSRLIRWKTSSEYSHCEIINNFDDNGFSTFGALPNKGVQFAGINWHKKGTEYDIFETEVTKTQFEEFRQYLTKQYKKKYDYLGVLGFIDSRVKQDDNKWFCSELVYKSLKHIEIELFNRDIKFPSPSLVSISPLLKLVESGVVEDKLTEELIKQNNDMQDLLNKVKKSSIQGDKLKSAVSCNGLTGTNFDRRLNNV